MPKCTYRTVDAHGSYKKEHNARGHIIIVQRERKFRRRRTLVPAGVTPTDDQVYVYIVIVSIYVYNNNNNNNNMVS